MFSSRIGFYTQPSASWNDWTTADVGVAQQVFNPSIGDSRDIAQSGLVSANAVVNYFATGASPFYMTNIQTISIDSVGNLSFSGNAVSTTQPLNFTSVATADLEGVAKVIVSNTTTAYIVGDITGGSVEFPSLANASIANATTMSNYNIFGNPDDNTDTVWWDETGDTNYITLDTSTDVLTWVRSGTAPANAKAGCGFWTLSGGTRKFAFLYYSTTNTDWRLRHYAEDLSSFSDVTLNATPDPAGTANKYHTWRQKDNVALHIVDDNATLPCFVVKYDGTNFTQYTSQNLSVPTGVTTQVRSVSCIYHIQDDTWAAIIEWENPLNTTQRLAYVYMLRVESDGSVTELGKLALAAAVSASSTNVKGGVGLTTDYAWAVIASEASNGGTLTPIYTVLKKPGT